MDGFCTYWDRFTMSNSNTHFQKYLLFKYPLSEISFEIRCSLGIWRKKKNSSINRNAQYISKTTIWTKFQNYKQVCDTRCSKLLRSPWSFLQTGVNWVTLAGLGYIFWDQGLLYPYMGCPNQDQAIKIGPGDLHHCSKQGWIRWKKAQKM